jgi:FkbM family methyltransferase
MTFISYAQNFEDVLLYRAFKNIEHGFYIDVGANDPEIDSVTKAFYDRGWSGINCEPLVSHYEDLKKARLRDINLNCAVGDVDGVFKIWECEIRGWATLSEEVKKKHEAIGLNCKEHQVIQTTLTKICSEHANNEIHFLKIDVEGFEGQVLKGFDLTKFRPWVLVIEAIMPTSQIPNFSSWEPILLKANYHFIYSDGLNRYYLADEQQKLSEFFQFPVNVMDEFIPAVQAAAETRIKEQEAELIKFQSRIFSLEDQVYDLKKELQETKDSMQAVFESTSWRVTAPLRALSELIGWKK